MDFVKIIRSVEEALYEVMSWVIFYPLTLWMVLRHPQRSMIYSDAEQRDKPEQQYQETLSPPLFLVLSLLLAYAADQAFRAPDLEAPTELGALIYGSTQNIMVFQALIFSVHPLLYAAVLLKCMGRKITRDSLRAPFFAQCYLSGATSILISLAGLAVQWGWAWALVSAGVVLATTVWYLTVQTRWFMRLDQMSAGKAFAVVAAVFLASGAVIMAALVALVVPGGAGA